MNDISQAGCGIAGCGCLLMILGVVGPIVVIVVLALAGVGN